MKKLDKFLLYEQSDYIQVTQQVHTINKVLL